MSANANATAWKQDHRAFVGKAFDYAYKDTLSKLAPIVGETTTRSVDYELVGSGGYGELAPYDGVNLNFGQEKRGFRTVITPHEFSLSETIGVKKARIDKSGECRRVGKKLGRSAAMTVQLHVLRTLVGAFNPALLGGDGKPWAAEDHPVSAREDAQRRRIPDPDSGTYSNLVNLALSVDAISKVRAMAGKYVTPDGLPYLADFDCLLVGPELEMEARKLFGENRQYLPKLNPDDNSNAANPHTDFCFLVVGGGAEGFSQRQWAICDRKRMKEIFNIVYGQRPKVIQSQLDNPLVDVHTAYTDFGVGYGDARPIIFSRGGK